MPQRDVATDPRPGDMVLAGKYVYEVLAADHSGVRVKISYESISPLGDWKEAVLPGAVIIRGAERVGKPTPPVTIDSTGELVPLDMD